MPESTINTIITSLATLLGAWVGAYATIHAARVKLQGNLEKPKISITTAGFLGAFLGAVGILVLLFLFGWFSPGTSITGEEGGTQQVDIYDDFDDRSYDGSLNYDLWVVNANDNMLAYQENGTMVLQASTPTDYGTMWINPSDGLETKIQDFNIFEAKFSWNSKVYNKLYFGMTVQQNWTETALVAYVCDFLMENNSTTFSCSGVDGDETVSSVYVSVQPDQTYTLRIEIDPSSAIFSTYLDNRLVSTYQPPNPSKWITGPVSYNVHLGVDPLSSGKFYVDDVRFGSSK